MESEILFQKERTNFATFRCLSLGSVLGSDEYQIGPFATILFGLTDSTIKVTVYCITKIQEKTRVLELLLMNCNNNSLCLNNRCIAIAILIELSKISTEWKPSFGRKILCSRKVSNLVEQPE